MRFAYWILIVVSSLVLEGCLSIPVVDDSDLMVEVLPPRHADDLSRAKEIVDTFSRKYGYHPISGLNQGGQAGDAYVKGFGYSGSLRSGRGNGLSNHDLDTRKDLPYSIWLDEGSGGELFFQLVLRSRDAEKSQLAIEFVQAIQSEFGKSRTRVAMPVVVSQLSIGD